MESPNREFRATAELEGTTKLELLSDQFKSMRDLLKVYGLSVGIGVTTTTGSSAEELHGNSQKGERFVCINSSSPPFFHPKSQ